MTFAGMNGGILIGVAESPSHAEEIAFGLRAAALPSEAVMVLGAASMRLLSADCDAGMQASASWPKLPAGKDSPGGQPGHEAALVVVEIHDMDQVEVVESVFQLFECRTVPASSGQSNEALAQQPRSSAADFGTREIA